MTERVRRYAVVLNFPFDPGGDYGMQPAGTYDVEAVEEQLDSISFIAFRRLLTLISKRPADGEQARSSRLMITSVDLDRVLADDQKRMCQASLKAP